MDEKRIPVSDKALEAIVGGGGFDPKDFGDVSCPNCGSKNYSVIGEKQGAFGPDYYLKCNDCGHEWHVTKYATNR